MIRGKRIKLVRVRILFDTSEEGWSFFILDKYWAPRLGDIQVSEDVVKRWEKAEKDWAAYQEELRNYLGVSGG